MNLLTKIGLGIVALAIAYASGRYFAPEKVKEVEVVRKETEYITREVKSPDGTVTKETIKKDTSQKSNEKIVELAKPNYKAGVLAQYDFDRKKTKYGALIEKRVAGPIFVGIYADTEKTIGASISLEF